MDFNVEKGTVSFGTVEGLMPTATKKIKEYFDADMAVVREPDTPYEVAYSMKTAAECMRVPPASEYLRQEDEGVKVEDIYSYLVENPGVTGRAQMLLGYVCDFLRGGPECEPLGTMMTNYMVKRLGLVPPEPEFPE